MTYRCYFPGTFHCRCHGINIISPVEQTPVPAVVRGDVIIFVPTEPSLVLSIVNGENGWYISQLAAERMTMSYHKWNKTGVMVVAMNNVGVMLPFVEPIAKSYLEGNESFIIV